MNGLESALEHYGPVVGLAVIFAGAFSEGHTAVIAGGFFAHQGLLNLWAAFLVAFAGSFIADQLLFVAGRAFRDRPFVVKAANSKAGIKALGFIEKYPTAYILAFRFIYGLRLASPVAFGVASTPANKFTILNLAGAALWAGVFTAIGYFCGETIEAAFGKSKALEHWIIVGVAVLVAAVLLFHLAKWIFARKPPQG